MAKFNRTPSDRMQLLGAGDMRPPGSCMHCGSSDSSRGYVDLNVYREMDGESYICDMCLTQAAEIIGCLHPDEASTLIADKLAADLKVQKYEEALTNAEQRLAVFDAAMRDAFNNGGPAATPSLANKEAAKQQLISSGAIEAPVSDADAGESEPAESVTNEEPARSNGDAAGHRPKRQFSI